jgi:hypothetical protein
MMGFALRCDRILWKSTVEPGPDSDDDESEAPLHPKAKTRVGRFFAKLECGTERAPTAPLLRRFPTILRRFPPPSVCLRSPLLPLWGKGSDTILAVPTPEAPEVVGSSPWTISTLRMSSKHRVSASRSFSVDQAQSEGKDLPRHRGPSRTGTTPTKPRPPLRNATAHGTSTYDYNPEG